MSRLRLRDPQGFELTAYKARHCGGEIRVVVDPPDHNLATRQYVLRNGKSVELKDGMTLPADVFVAEEPDWLWPRDPPIRHRLNVPTSWIELGLREGRNRQVRRMTAAVGHPTLRLIRVQIGGWELGDLQPGEWRVVGQNLAASGRMRAR